MWDGTARYRVVNVVWIFLPETSTSPISLLNFVFMLQQESLNRPT